MSIIVRFSSIIDHFDNITKSNEFSLRNGFGIDCHRISLKYFWRGSVVSSRAENKITYEEITVLVTRL